MRKENKTHITISQYCKDTNKWQQSVHKLLLKGVTLPGIEEYDQLHPKTWILKKARNYASECKRLRGQKFIIA